MNNNYLNIAAYIVLFGFSLLFGFLGKPTEMGLAILAGSLGLAFLNIDKIKRFKGAGFEAEMKEKQLNAIIQKETEPVEEISHGFTCEAYGSDEKSGKVIKALLNERYTWRYLEGISKESGLSREESLEILNWLYYNQLATQIVSDSGKLWSLTAKGRNVFAASYGA